MKKTSILTFLALFLSMISYAEVRLPSLVGDNMVLQRNTQVNLWGQAKADSKVVVKTSWNDAKYVTRSDDEGNWSLVVSTGEAGGPYEISISDGQPVVLKNILLGEVWICGGQSNMEMPVCGFLYQPVENAHQHIIYARETPDIRMFTVPKASSEKLETECGGEWLVSDPKNVSSFSAVAYFFGKSLYRALGGDIPIGLITSNWGGTPIEAWMTVERLDSIEGIDHEIARKEQNVNCQTQRLYNGMIWPIKDYTAKGFIWYQGESNRHNWFDYKKLMVNLVDLWRKSWKNDEMPFYYVQLAPYTYEGDALRSLPLVIEAQYQALEEIPHSGIAATTDLGNRLCIHPQKKVEVGERLACLALLNDYGLEGVPLPAPTYKSMKLENDKNRGNMLVLSFNNMCPEYSWNSPDSFKGYEPDGYGTPKGFEIAGADRKFYKARANYRWWENKIEVWSEQVPEPVAVRYAFCNYPAEANVVTSMGQPLAPFRTDDWPVEDIWK